MVFTSYCCFCHQFLYETPTDVNLKGVNFFNTSSFSPFKCVLICNLAFKKITSKLFFWLLPKTVNDLMIELFSLQPFLLKTESNVLTPGGLGTVIYIMSAENEGFMYSIWPFLRH